MITFTIIIISLHRLDIDDDEDPYPSLQHVRTSASGLLRFPDDGEDDDDDGEDDDDGDDDDDDGEGIIYNWDDVMMVC